MEGWGLGFDQDLLKIMGRVLPAEKIFQKNPQGVSKQLDIFLNRMQKFVFCTFTFINFLNSKHDLAPDIKKNIY